MTRKERDGGTQAARICGRRARRLGLALGIALAAVALAAEGALANGGTLRIANAVIGAYRVSVFTDPTPVRPDTLDVSVLVIRADDGSVVEGLDVRVRADPIDAEGAPRSLSASREAADDPRYYAAKFSLGATGAWRITVEVEGPEGTGDASFELRARDWGILVHPLFVILVSLLPLVLVGWWLLRSGEEGGRDGEDPEGDRVRSAARPAGP